MGTANCQSGPGQAAGMMLCHGHRSSGSTRVMSVYQRWVDRVPGILAAATDSTPPIVPAGGDWTGTVHRRQEINASLVGDSPKVG